MKRLISALLILALFISAMAFAEDIMDIAEVADIDETIANEEIVEVFVDAPCESESTADRGDCEDPCDSEPDPGPDWETRYTQTITVKNNQTIVVYFGETVKLVPAGTVAATSFSIKSKALATFDPDYPGVLTANGTQYREWIGGKLVTAATGKTGTTTVTIKLANKKKMTVTLKVLDPTKPRSIKLINEYGGEQKRLTLVHGDTYDLHYTLNPETSIGSEDDVVTWKSSSTKVVRVIMDYSGNPRLYAVGSGTATITATTKNKKKTTLKVTVKGDTVNWNDDGPSCYDGRDEDHPNWKIEYANNVDIWLKSVNIASDSKIVAEFWILNGYNRTIKYLKGFDVSIYYDSELLAGKYSKKISVSCKKKSTKVFKVTFTPINFAEGVDLSKIKLEDRDKVEFAFGDCWVYF